MADLDTLRPEVREAINRTDMTVEMFDTLVTVNRDDYDIVRAELRRLATRNAELEAKTTRDHDWISDLLAENQNAYVEPAALNARMKPCARVGGGEVRAFMDPADEGKYVAVLVVAE